VASAATALAAPTEHASDWETMIRDELVSMLPRLRRLPDRIDRITMLAARGDLRTRSVIDEDGARIFRTLIIRSLLAAAGAAFLLGGALLLVAGEEGPAVSGGAGLFETLGYGGLLAGSVLLLRVIGAVARDGTT
jgi:ubiquinone biosynthesis protein